MTETVAPGVVSDGNGLVLWVPTIANPAKPTVAELTASGVVPLTYSLFGDGFAHTTDVALIESTRYTLAQMIQAEGIETDKITVKYPYTNTEEDVARTTLKRGTRGFIVERLAIANGEPIAADQILSIVAPITCGLAKGIPPTSNTELGKEQNLLVTGKVERDVVVVGP